MAELADAEGLNPSAPLGACGFEPRPGHAGDATDLWCEDVGLGLPELRGPHSLRHTWATLAFEAGVHPKVVSERLGHSTIAITLDTYSHVVEGMDADAATRVADQIFKKADEK